MIDFTIGDYVRTSRHGFTGRVSGIRKLDLTDKRMRDWLSEQQIPVTEAEARGFWCSILVHGGGSIETPVSAVTRIEPFDFRNRDAAQVFGE